MSKINWPFEFERNKYSDWYHDLIKKSKNRILEKNIYVEKHHVIPRSFGGTNDDYNIVNLTAREHYVAHLLLWKMNFSKEYHDKMSYALRMMIFKPGSKKDARNYFCNSRIYETVRKEFSKKHSESMKGEKNPFYGKQHTVEVMEKIKETRKQPGRGGYRFKPGHKLSEDSIKKMSDSKKGLTWDKIYDPETLALRKKQRSEETRLRNMTRVFSDETRKKMSEKAKARCAKGPAVDIKYNLGKKQSPETVAKRLATMKEKGITTHNKIIKICEYCNKEVKLNVYTRYHGMKCKKKGTNEQN